MIQIADLIRMLSIENNVVHDQTSGLTHADTLIQPQPGANCMNWVLGHMLENQVSLLEAIGGELPIQSAALERYQRTSEPVMQDEPGLPTLEELLDGHDRVHAAISARLAEMSDADFAVEIPRGDRMVTRGWRVFFLHFHYTYHLGQLEFLRQAAGKTDKVI